MSFYALASIDKLKRCENCDSWKFSFLYFELEESMDMRPGDNVDVMKDT